MKLKLFSGLLLVAQTLTLTPALAERVEFRDGVGTFELPRVEGVVFRHSHPDGDLTVVGVEGGTVRVEMEGRKREDETLFPSFLRWDEESGAVTLQLRGEALDRDLRVFLPRALAVNLTVVNGDLAIEGMAGAIEVRAVDGKVRVDGATDALLVESTDGDVTVVQGEPSPSRPIALGSVDGDVRLVLPKAFAGILDMSTTDGEIRYRLDGKVKIDQRPNGSRRGLSRQVLEVNGGKTRVLLYTVDGDIEVETR